MIVALLCLTLFVDSAKACWWLRQHRSRSQVCRPVACEPSSSQPCSVVMVESHDHEMVIVDDQAACCRDVTTVEHAGVDQAVDHAAVAQVIEHGAVEHAARAEDSVVVHGPTMVVDAAPAHPAAGVAEPASVVTQPAADKPVAQPMPVAAAGPSVLSTPTPAQEPIPELKPAIPPESPVAPASNEQPMPELSAADASDEAERPAAPMPAPVEDLAGGPTTKPVMPEPKEPNLFDLYADEDEAAPAEEAPGEDAPADAPSATADDGAVEPAEDATDEAAPAEEAEMAEEESEDAQSEAPASADSDGSETAEEPAPAEEPAEEAANEADAAQESEPEQAEADPAEAARVVPNEPMRRWTDETGTHHTQGWLVELRADRVRILKVNGRHTTVATESLSAEDRDYVSAVGARLAAEAQGNGPAPSTTAGL